MHSHKLEQAVTPAHSCSLFRLIALAPVYSYSHSRTCDITRGRQPRDAAASTHFAHGTPPNSPFNTCFQLCKTTGRCHCRLRYHLLLHRRFYYRHRHHRHLHSASSPFPSFILSFSPFFLIIQTKRLYFFKALPLPYSLLFLVCSKSVLAYTHTFFQCPLHEKIPISPLFPRYFPSAIYLNSKRL